LDRAFSYDGVIILLDPADLPPILLASFDLINLDRLLLIPNKVVKLPIGMEDSN